MPGDNHPDRLNSRMSMRRQSAVVAFFVVRIQRPEPKPPIFIPEIYWQMDLGRLFLHLLPFDRPSVISRPDGLSSYRSEIQALLSCLHQRVSRTPHESSGPQVGLLGRKQRPLTGVTRAPETDKRTFPVDPGNSQ